MREPKPRPLCYYSGCEAVPTTVEHCPPRCIFPLKHETISGNSDFRKNLITAPSCAEHNTDTTECDAIFMALALNIPCKNTHGIHFARTDRARKTRTQKLSKSVIESQTVNINGYKHIIEQVNVYAQMTVLGKLARGLYFHDSGKKERFDGLVMAIPLLQLGDDMQPSPGSPKFHHHIFPRILPMPRMGENPEIFYYQRIYRMPSRANVYTYYMLSFFEVPTFVLTMQHGATNLPDGSWTPLD